MAPKLEKMSPEELVELQQVTMAAREDVDSEFRDRLAAIQYELDKRDATRRFGTLSPAEREALAAMNAEA